jgi:serine/threonine-protein kinase
LIGTSLGRYDIQEELGQGGMSVVYHGRDRSLGRDVAVKVLHNHLAKKAENRERFHREARAIARLKHTNILEIYDYAQADEEHAFIVMEYVAGINLREFVERHGAIPTEYAALIAIELCDALAHAHAQGIIHRDLKPENVMVSTQGQIKLMDFGIAHIFDAETMTQTGSLLGSPAHMAPELIEGERVDVRADIFALGTVLYWLVCGKLPFDGKNAPQILKRVMEGAYKRPEALDPRVGQHMGEVIARCMAHRPEDRYADVAQARAALDALIAHAPLTAPLTVYLRDPQTIADNWSAKVLGWLVKRGCDAMQAGQTVEALRCFNRALGYDPQHPEVCAALERLQRPTSRVALVGALLLVTCGVAAVIWALIPPAPAPEAPVLAPAPSPAPRPVPTVEAPGPAPEAINAAISTASQALDAHRSAAHADLAAKPLLTRTARDARRVASLIALTQRIKSRTAPQETITPVEAVNPAGPAATALQDAPTEHLYRFNVLPRAASLTVQGKKYTALEALQGIKLVPGKHAVRVESVGCKPMVTQLDLTRPPADNAPPVSLTMQWQDGTIQILSEFDVFVWLDDAEQPTRLVQAKKPAILRIPFGAASLDSPRKTIRLRISRKNDLLRTHQETFTLAPGAQHIVTVNAASLR